MRGALTWAAAAAILGLAACAPVPPLKEYAYPAWGFAVSFRTPPKVTETPAATGQDHRLIVESSLAGRDNLVLVLDGSASTRTADQALTDAPAALARSVGGTPGPLTYVAAGRAIGREFTMTRPDRPTSLVRVFVADKRLFEVISQSPLGTDDPETTAFMGSFRLLGS